MAEIDRIIIVNELSGMTEDDCEYKPPDSSFSFKCRRETVAEFQDRAASEAEAAGATTVIFGHGGQQKRQS